MVGEGAGKLPESTDASLWGFGGFVATGIKAVSPISAVVSSAPDAPL